jgi:DNA-binding transcriptional MerR regulator
MNHSVRSQKLRAEECPLGGRLYSVKELAKAAGVSVRALHVYDEMGLLKPARRTESRYRLYGERELLRLQQILFYKELDFSLHEIKNILDSPDFDLVEALKRHKSSLLLRRERLGALLSTIDKTLLYLTQGDQEMTYQMTAEELYEGLPKEFADEYRNEVSERWSEALQRSEQALRAMTKADFQKLKDDFQENWRALAAMTDRDPASDAVQERILRHYTLTRAFWGTSSSEDKQAEQFKGLARLYLDDARFTTIDGEARPDFAPFLAKAMERFVAVALEA